MRTHRRLDLAQVRQQGGLVVTVDLAPRLGGGDHDVGEGGVGPEAEKICHALLERDVCTDYRGDGLRISPHFFNTEKDIDRCFEELARLV